MDIRQAQRTDCARLSVLIAQLEYNAAQDFLERRIEEYDAMEQDRVLVGVEEGHIVGTMNPSVHLPHGPTSARAVSEMKQLVNVTS